MVLMVVILFRPSRALRLRQLNLSSYVYEPLVLSLACIQKFSGHTKYYSIASYLGKHQLSGFKVSHYSVLRSP